MAKGSNKSAGKSRAGTGNDNANTMGQGETGGHGGTGQSGGPSSASTMGSYPTGSQQGSAMRGGGAGTTALVGAMGLSGSQSGTSTRGPSAIEALKQDHRRVESLFSQFESADDDHRKEELVAMICMELNIHSRLEEEIFYPACREEIDEEDLMDEAQVEHDAAKILIADLMHSSCDDPYYDAKVKLLQEQIRHHVAEEESPGEGVFAKAQAHQVDSPRLAAELSERKQELQRRGTRLQPTRAVAFDLDLRSLMGGGDSRPFREDERRYGRGGDRQNDERRGSRYRREDEERGQRSGGGWFGGRDDRFRGTRDWPERDDQGRSGSGGWREQGGRVRYGERQDEDDRDHREAGSRGGHGGHGGHGGWFGDSEGHARAARRRWEEQEDDRRGGGRDWDRRR